MNLFDLQAKIVLDTSDYENGLKSASKNSSVFFDVLKANLSSGVIMQGFKTLTNAVVGFGKSTLDTGLQFNRQMENYELAFQNLLGSAEAANAALDAIKADAASTPFDVAGLVSANRLLISTGQSAEEARQVINALGNAVSASGGGNVELERMASNLQQIANVGKASAVDVRQFAYAGIDIYGILADYTGLAKDEVQDLTISYDLLTDALKAASEEGGRYAGAMEAYSQTLQGQMDTLADNATQAMGLVTEGVHNALIPIVGDLSATLDEFTASVDWDAWSLEVQQAVTGAYSVIKTLIDFLLQNGKEVISLITGVASAFATWKIISSVTAAVSTLTAAISAAGGLTAALGAVVAAINPVTAVLSVLAGAFGVAYSESEVFRDTVNAAVRDMYNYCSGLLADLADTAANLWSSITTGTNKNDVRNDPEWLAAQARNGNTQAAEQLDKITRRNQAAALQAQADADRAVDWEAVADYNARKSVPKAAAATTDYAAALDKAASSAGKAAKQTETLADKLNNAYSALTASQSAYNTLSDAIDEYNETGSISLATWQDLMDLAPEYQALLVQENGKLKLNQAAYNELTAAQRLEIETLAQANGVLPETIQLIDSLGITAEKAADEAELAAKRLDEALEKLSDAWDDSFLAKLKDLASDILGGDFEDALLDAGEIAWKKLDTATQQQLVDMAQGWIETLETAFSQDGFEGLVEAGKTIVQSLAAGLQDTGSVTGSLLDSVLGQVGISGGVEGLLGVLADLGPIVLGVVGTVAAVAAGVAGVAAAFSYTVDQSRALQEQIQALTEDGQELTDELSAALEVLQPIMDQIDGMLSQLDQVTSLFSDTFKGIGIEIMETMIPIIQQILNIILPVLENLQPALEAVGDLLRTLLELFGNLVSSVLNALQPVLQAVGPLLETLAELLNSIASIVSAVLSPALKALGELLNWLLQPILWVAQAINDVVEWLISLINPILKFLGLGTISLPDGSAINKGGAISSIGAVGDYVTPSTSTGTSSSGTTIQKVEIYIEGAQYQDPESLAEAISIQLQNLTERKVNVFA